MKKIKILIFILFILLSGSSGVVFADGYQSGVEAFNGGNYLKAEKYFRSALTRNPENTSLRYYLAITLVKNNKYRAAKKEYTTIINTAPNSEAAYLSTQGLNLLSNSDKVILNIENHGTSLIVRDLKVNNIVSTDFILDSGATYTSISTSLARKLRLSTAHTPRVSIMTANGIIKAPRTILKSIEIEGLEAKNVEAVILDIPSSREVSGLLGLSFIKQFKVTIDKQNGKLILEKP